VSQVIESYCSALFDDGADNEEFFYRLGLKDGIRFGDG
jgi:hypothetical protein